MRQQEGRFMATRSKRAPRRWSRHVMETSDALDLDRGVFSLDDPQAIARSLKRSAEKSTRRKAEPFRSALSMLTFYINRGGKNLSARRKKILELAKDELRRLYKRPPRGKKTSGQRSRRPAKTDGRRSKRATRAHSRGSKRASPANR
jgi:uncharacterized protein DUF3175